MKSYTTYERLMPDTFSGERVKISTIISSFNKDEIDEFEEVYCKGRIGFGIGSGEITLKKEGESE